MLAFLRLSSITLWVSGETTSGALSVLVYFLMLTFFMRAEGASKKGLRDDRAYAKLLRMSNLPEDLDTPAYLLSSTDRELAEGAFNLDALIIEGQAYACDAKDYEGLPYRELALINREIETRLRLGIEFSRPEEHIEYQLAPFGSEWELEQRERMGVR